MHAASRRICSNNTHFFVACCRSAPCGAVSGILDLPEGEEVVVAGTAYKEMKLKVGPVHSASVAAPLAALLGLQQLPESVS